MKRRIISGGILTVVLLAVILFCITESRPSDSTHLPLMATVVSETGKVIKVSIADTEQKRELGLSFFTDLPPDQGMMFLFNTPGRNRFWMKGMNFPIDIIWLKKESETSYRVIYRKQNLSPATYPESFSPADDTDAVLETAALVSSSAGIVEGSLIELTFNR